MEARKVLTCVDKRDHMRSEAVGTQEDHCALGTQEGDCAVGHTRITELSHTALA